MKPQRSKTRTRLRILGCALILCATASAANAADASQAAGAIGRTSEIGRASEIDPALLWGRSIDQVSSVMAMKLGFQVRPGRNPDGVANRYVRFGDRSYLELFGMERADAKMDPGMQADQASLHGGPGARTFGLRSSILEQAQAWLQAQGFAPTPIFTAPPDDPDGDGLSKPPRWRLFAFERPVLSSHLFYIDYSTLEATPARVVDTRVAHEHPNGARALTGIWLLSADADADREDRCAEPRDDPRPDDRRGGVGQHAGDRDDAGEGQHDEEPAAFAGAVTRAEVERLGHLARGLPLRRWDERLEHLRERRHAHIIA